MAQQVVCTACGTVGYAKRVTKGSFFIELVLWLAMILPGLLYSIWRMTSRHNACAKCGGLQIVPTDSPVGQKLIAEHRHG